MWMLFQSKHSLSEQNACVTRLFEWNYLTKTIQNQQFGPDIYPWISQDFQKNPPTGYIPNRIYTHEPLYFRLSVFGCLDRVSLGLRGVDTAAVLLLPGSTAHGWCTRLRAPMWGIDTIRVDELWLAHRSVWRRSPFGYCLVSICPDRCPAASHATMNWRW